MPSIISLYVHIFDDKSAHVICLVQSIKKTRGRLALSVQLHCGISMSTNTFLTNCWKLMLLTKLVFDRYLKEDILLARNARLIENFRYFTHRSVKKRTEWKSRHATEHHHEQNDCVYRNFGLLLPYLTKYDVLWFFFSF